MSGPDTSSQPRLPGFDEAKQGWERAYAHQLPEPPVVRNRSGIEIRPIYGPDDWDGSTYLDTLGFPGEAPFTRGIYPTMYRGRTWTQRQLIGLGTPADYNERVRELLAHRATAISLLPCNSDSVASIATRCRAHVDDFVEFEAARSRAEVDRAVAALRRAARSDDENIFARVVDAAEVGVTHGEIVSSLRDELGFGEPLVVV